ncbi:MAG: response regulator [Armatimonadetes bacterium]|nr:response regulator [Armatimonadota bacterium]
MSARLALILRYVGLVILALAILLIIIRWRVPMRERRSRSLLDIARGLYTRWKERREEAREHARDIAALRHKKALVVGMEDKALRVMRWKLEGLGCTVVTARTGRHGVAAAQRERPDVVIVDVLLPDMSAVDFYESLGEHNKPVAFVGVQDKQWNELRMLGRNVVCVGRPFDPEDVAAAIGYIIRKNNL